MYDVCIIGAGFSGIISTLECVKTNLNTITLEHNPDIGGTWYQTYPNTRLQSHKTLYEFTGYPYPPNTSLYPTRDEIINYLNSIVDTAHIRRYFRFNKKVVNIYKNSNSNNSNSNNSKTYWTLVTKDTVSKKTVRLQAKYIIVATGLFNVAKFPNIKGKETFRGLMLHTKEVDKTYNPKGKNVVIIGNGSSGIDLATMSCKKKAKSVTIVYRTPKWIFMRNFYNPSHYYNYFTLQILYHLHLNGIRSVNMVMFKAAFIIIYVIKLYLKGPFIFPDKPVSRNNIVINDDFLDYYNRDKIAYLNDTIKSVGANKIILANQILKDIDIIIFATGFRGAPVFLNHTLPPLYKYIVAIHPELTDVFFMGFASTLANLPKLLQSQIKYIINRIRTRKRVGREEMIKNLLYQVDTTNKLGVPDNDITYNYYQYIKSIDI